jgi:hypothetical protein
MDDIRNRDDTCLHDPLEHLLDRCTASLDRHELIEIIDRLTRIERDRIRAEMASAFAEGCGCSTGRLHLHEAAAFAAIDK